MRRTGSSPVASAAPIALIDRPTLVVGGRDDAVTLASHREFIASAILGAELRILPCMHMPNVERPHEFMQAITTFLNV
jgi:3-oxoadipate enol-lactonase